MKSKISGGCVVCCRVDLQTFFGNFRNVTSKTVEICRNERKKNKKRGQKRDEGRGGGKAER